MSWRKGVLADLFQDLVVYRNLEPMDESVLGLRASWKEIGLGEYRVPRKTEPAYARVLMHYLAQAQSMRGQLSLQRMLFIGDTLMNDGTAARNMARYLPLQGFIGSDRLAQEREVRLEGDLMVANRWAALGDYLQWLEQEGFPCDERTALLIDLDKTSLGARGRNDHVINAARVSAVERTMQQALGEDFGAAAFRRVYDRLNQGEYHRFTADNQDYLAYVCLMVHAGICGEEELWSGLAGETLADVDDFVGLCHERRKEMSAGLYAAHEQVRQGRAQGDPTPFKAFRRGEYYETVACMDSLDDDASPEEALNQEILMTAEVASAAGYLADKGVLVFGISDKPDEASVPTPDAAARGYRAIHHTPMKIYGDSVT